MNINIKIIDGKKSAKKEGFYEYLNRPDWFKEKFTPVFEEYRKETEERFLILANNGEKTCGCVFIDLNSLHINKGNNIPIFGWVQADTIEVFDKMVEKMKEMLISDKNSKDSSINSSPIQIRGPINYPKIFGGWGAMESGDKEDPLVNSSWGELSTQDLIESSTHSFIKETTYYHYNIPTKTPVVKEIPNIRLTCPNIEQLQQDGPFKTKIMSFVAQNFSGFLPDIGSNYEEMMETLNSFDHPEDFYLIAIDETKPEDENIAAVIIVLPNIFDVWAGKKPDTFNYDTLIVGKEYRKSGLQYTMGEQMLVQCYARGIMNGVSSYLWSENKPMIGYMEHYGFSKRNIINVYDLKV